MELELGVTEKNALKDHLLIQETITYHWIVDYLKYLVLNETMFSITVGCNKIVLTLAHKLQLMKLEVIILQLVTKLEELSSLILASVSIK